MGTYKKRHLELSRKRGRAESTTKLMRFDMDRLDHSPESLLMPMLVRSVPSSSTPVPFIGSPLLIASSVKTLPMGCVGVIMFL